MRVIETFARTSIIALSAFSLSWVAFAVPQFAWAATKSEVASRLLADDRIKPSALRDAIAASTGRSQWYLDQSKIQRAQALIHFRIAEESGRIDIQEGDLARVRAMASISSSLASNPGDAYLWLALYSTQLLSEGFDPKAVSYLGASYVLGPMEGRIALRRNRLALAAFPLFGDDLQAKIVSEFCALVNSQFIDTAVLNFVSSGPYQRNRLLQSLSQTDLIPREMFAKQLAREAVSVTVPGVSIDERFLR
ncbi:hypothetical protein [Bradyrhizobium sp. CIR3A]|uniref:hypothetical protein n=1 Tax=Bradyrhizobium sp. CIR3A TaxID=2663838 RepID=UPI001606E0AD|nr:hypothetical protein [Bradyrhizobium sp. CIR3A]MBB4260155.1 hypothetical protein [Bradyrhizobium sp. CIR3A]